MFCQKLQWYPWFLFLLYAAAAFRHVDICCYENLAVLLKNISYVHTCEPHNWRTDYTVEEGLSIRKKFETHFPD